MSLHDAVDVMEYQRDTDFDFSWWLSMTPAILFAVYFVCRWNDHRSEVLDLAGAVASIVMGVIVTALICNPNSKTESKPAKPAEGTPLIQLGCKSDQQTVHCDSTIVTSTRETTAVSTVEQAKPLRVKHAEPLATGAPDNYNSELEEELSRTTIGRSLGSLDAEWIETQIHGDTCTEAVVEDRCMASESTPTDPLSIAPRTTISRSSELGSWFSKGLSLMKSRNFRDALYCFSYILQRNPDHVASLNAKAKCLIELKRYDEALRLYMHAIRLDASDAIAQEGIAFANKQLQEARLH